MAHLRKDVVIQQTFKSLFEQAVNFINQEIRISTNDALGKIGYENEILTSIQPTYSTPIIKFENKKVDSLNEKTIKVEIPIINNPEIFEKILNISVGDPNFNKSVKPTFVHHKSLNEGVLTFWGESKDSLSETPELIENFKKNVERNLALIQEYLDIYTKEYLTIKNEVLLPLAKAQIEKLKQANLNIQKNKDILNNW